MIDELIAENWHVHLALIGGLVVYGWVGAKVNGWARRRRQATTIGAGARVGDGAAESLLEVAWLASGVRRVFAAAVIDLAARGLIEWETEGNWRALSPAETGRADPPDLPPYEQALLVRLREAGPLGLSYLTSAARMLAIWPKLGSHENALYERLLERGYLPTAEGKARGRGVEGPAVIALILAGFVAAWFINAHFESAGMIWAFIYFVEAVILGMIGLMITSDDMRLAAAGERRLEALQVEHRDLAPLNDAGGHLQGAVGDDRLPLAVALYGTGVLMGTRFEPFAGMLAEYENPD